MGSFNKMKLFNSVLFICCLAHLTGATIIRWTVPNVSASSGCSSDAASILETAATGTRVILLKAVTSGTVVRYKLESSSIPRLFAIDESGAVVLSGLFGHENKTVSKAIVVASALDDLGGRGTVVFDVKIIAANLHAPRFERNAYYVKLSQGVAIATSVFQAHAIDPDRDYNGELTYAIAGGDSHHNFVIDAYTGTVFLASTKNLLEAANITLVITARDNGVPALTGTTTLVVATPNYNTIPVG